MSNPRRSTSAWSLALLASYVAASCTPAQHLSTTPAEPGGLELQWQQPIAASDGVDQAPWLAVGPAAAFVAGPAVGLTAFALTGGSVLWSSSHISAVPPVALGDVVVTLADDGLVAVRQDRDDVAWRVSLDASPDMLSVVGDRLGVTIGLQLRTFDALGAAGWRLTLDALPSTPFVSESGQTFVGLENADLLAIDTATGAIQWRIRMPAKPESLASGNGRLYASAANGHLYAFESRANSKAKWDYGKIRAIGQPVVDARSAYFTLKNNVLYAFTQGGGSERWHLALPDRPVTGPFLFGDTIVVPLVSGRVIEVRKDGHVRPPGAGPALPVDLTLQFAALTSDRGAVVTVTTASDQKRILIGWAPPKASGGVSKDR